MYSCDCNPAQSALLELKQVAIRQLNYEDVWSLFGEGKVGLGLSAWAAMAELHSMADGRVRYTTVATHGSKGMSLPTAWRCTASWQAQQPAASPAQ